MKPPDVPSPIDLRKMPDALEWEQSAMLKRPWRTDFFESIAAEVEPRVARVNRILELGSGPGFLARHLLETLSDIEYVLLDFSPAMHRLAEKRLGNSAPRIEYLLRDFKAPEWTRDLPAFDCVVTMQAVHELRHKRYAAELHAQVRTILPGGGAYLVCDHFAGEGGMKNDQLFMTVEEQREALHVGGFSHVAQVMIKGGMALHRAA